MIKQSTMKALLDDTGYTACRITPESEFIKKEFKGNKSMYCMMIGIKKQNFNNRKQAERMIVEFDGRTLLMRVESELNLGE